jgi:hypothetical protein
LISISDEHGLWAAEDKRLRTAVLAVSAHNMTCLFGKQSKTYSPGTESNDRYTRIFVSDDFDEIDRNDEEEDEYVPADIQQPDDIKISPSEFFASEDNRHHLCELFVNLHLMLTFIDSREHHPTDCEHITHYSHMIMIHLDAMKAIIHRKIHPLRVPCAHMFFSHMLTSIKRFGPQHWRKVDLFEGEQGTARNDVALTNRSRDVYRALRVIFGSLFRSSCICWCSGGPIIPHTDEFLKLTSSERHRLRVELISEGHFLTAGAELRSVMTDPIWNKIAKRISPFFTSLLDPRRRQLSLYQLVMCSCQFSGIEDIVQRDSRKYGIHIRDVVR